MKSLHIRILVIYSKIVLNFLPEYWTNNKRRIAEVEKAEKKARIAAFTPADRVAYRLEEAKAKRESKAVSEQLKQSKLDALERAEALIAFRDIANGALEDAEEELEEPDDQADDEDNDYEIWSVKYILKIYVYNLCDD